MLKGGSHEKNEPRRRFSVYDKRNISQVTSQEKLVMGAHNHPLVDEVKQALDDVEKNSYQEERIEKLQLNEDSGSEGALGKRIKFA